MHLRRLVVRGFKSFADRTVLDFAPGISVIVGPNGSGKSNIVDAIAWVLGEHSAKSLRGGKMEDVIFAGTPQRPAHGRAEVELTIDNSDQRLPIDFAEVSIRRTLFRSGESEYAINGTPCRLLDIQELLSDSGIGREMHSLVGQGHLDDILSGSPMDRRAAIEEAAGLLKYRKRKERSLRKLERVEADLERLGDVLNELKRQIRPLERQAEVAKRAASLNEELHEARLRLWVLDHRAVLGEDDADAAAAAARSVQELTAAAAVLADRIDRLEAEASLAQRDAESLLTLELRLSGARDRFTALAGLATERGERLADRAARAPADQAPTEEELNAARAMLSAASDARAEADAEQGRLEQQRSLAHAARERAAAARERLMTLQGELAGLRAAIDRARTEQTELSDALTSADEEELRAARERVVSEREALEELESRERMLATRSGELDARLDAEREKLTAALQELETLDKGLSALHARRGVLDEELARNPDAWSTLAGLQGMIGRIVDEVEIPDDHLSAVRAALGPSADAVLARDLVSAMSGIRALREAGARATIALPSKGAELPEGLARVSDLVAGSGEGADIVRDMLRDIALADDLDHAERLVREHPGLAVVTRQGDRLAVDSITGGAAEVPRDVRAELATVSDQIDAATSERARLAEAASAAQGQVDVVKGMIAELEAAFNELDAETTGAQDRLESHERRIADIERERAVTGRRLQELEQRIEADEARRQEVERALEAALGEEPEADEEILAGIERDLARRALALGELTERERQAEATLRALQERAARASAEHARFEQGRAGWIKRASRCREVAEAANAVVVRIEGWLEEATAARAGGEERRQRSTQALQAARAERRDVESRLEVARNLAHEADLRQADRTHRLAALENWCREKLGMEPSEALEAVAPEESERAGLDQTVATLERKLSLLGKINPIAMEQYDELVERRRFLDEQADDLRRSKADLLKVVEEVDSKIVEIFGKAFNDVATEFEAIFPRLFPGGEGSIELTDPENLLETGIEVQARPAGKKIKRVSLLSGGERSLVALGLLFSIFRSRPSPFYLLDEVEAALDDANLHRLLSVLREFRETAQLLIVTHQKRTMAIGDTLYGISMAGDGVTQVLSESLEELPEVV
ncbi:MAG: chromosome segregation protein SMC [Actinomycetota bacterium]